MISELKYFVVFPRKAMIRLIRLICSHSDRLNKNKITLKSFVRLSSESGILCQKPHPSNYNKWDFIVIICFTANSKECYASTLENWNQCMLKILRLSQKVIGHCCTLQKSNILKAIIDNYVLALPVHLLFESLLMLHPVFEIWFVKQVRYLLCSLRSYMNITHIIFSKNKTINYFTKLKCSHIKRDT